MPLLSPLLSAGCLKHASVCCALLLPPQPLAQSAGQVTLTQRSSRILQAQQQQHRCK
jgi:hypothetical protein